MSLFAKKKSGFQGQKQWPPKFHKKFRITETTSLIQEIFLKNTNFFLVLPLPHQWQAVISFLGRQNLCIAERKQTLIIWIFLKSVSFASNIASEIGTGDCDKEFDVWAVVRSAQAVSHHPHFDCRRGQRMFWWDKSNELERMASSFQEERYSNEPPCVERCLQGCGCESVRSLDSRLGGVGRTCLRRLRSALARLRPTDSNQTPPPPSTKALHPITIISLHNEG